MLRWYYDTIWICINNSGGALIQTVNFSTTKSTQSDAVFPRYSKRWACKFTKVHQQGLITIIYT
jgi:hypothetical protein